MIPGLFLLELVILSYFVAMHGVHALALMVAARRLASRLRADDAVRLNDLIGTEIHKPISILMPAYGEEATIEASVRSMLDLHYPAFEVIVIHDGGPDRTMEVLHAAFDLRYLPEPPWRGLDHAPVRGAYRSAVHPNLVVIDKENGGKADALNAGLEHARTPLVCAVDADSLLDAGALARIAADFTHDPTLVAAGGTIRVLNGTERAGGIGRSQLRAPRRWVERFQVVEYARAFLAARTAFSAASMLLIVSGAFGVFRRDAVLEVGGYRTDTVGEDMELVVRLHRQARDRRRPYRIRYQIDPVCWTQVPSDFGTLRRQRDRWHRGLLETLWRHRDMMFRPRYGRLGFVALPYYWAFEAVGPVLELLGYAVFFTLLLLGMLNAPFVTAFFALAIVYGVLNSVAAFGIEAFLRTRYGTVHDRALLLAAALLENFGYRPWLAWVRFRATFRVVRAAGEWGEMRRERID